MDERRAFGFSALEVVVVVIVLLVLAAIAVPVVMLFKSDARTANAKSTMKSLVAALEAYKADWGDYPPDNYMNGSEMIAEFLCQRFPGKTQGAPSRGPYLQAPAEQLVAAPDGHKKFISPFGTEYHYVVMLDEDKHRHSYVLVDPGPDRELGGTLNPFRGFVPSNADVNKDGVPDDKDNIIGGEKK